MLLLGIEKRVTFDWNFNRELHGNRMYILKCQRHNYMTLTLQYLKTEWA